MIGRANGDKDPQSNSSAKNVILIHQSNIALVSINFKSEGLNEI